MCIKNFDHYFTCFRIRLCFRFPKCLNGGFRGVFWFGQPMYHFWYLPKRPKRVILAVFCHFEGRENGTSGARIKILRPLFNRNIPPPLKPPFRHDLDPRKVIFSHFALLVNFGHFHGRGDIFLRKCMIFNRNSTYLNDILFSTSGYHRKALCA